MTQRPTSATVFRASWPWIAVAIVTWNIAPSAMAAPAFDFELVTESAFPLGGAQQWLELFTRLGQTSIRIRQAEGGERESLENQGTAELPRYRVIGVLTDRNRLRLKGGEFGLGDRARLEDWIKKVQEDGVSGPTAKAGAFGLTDEQLVAMHDKLATPISCQTRGRRIGDVARDIIKSTALSYVVSDTAKEAFRGEETCADDLQRLSSGTALAAAVRPLGLVIRPEKVPGGSPRLLVCGVRETSEAWPIGWPLQEIPGKVAPKLFEYLKVTIVNRPLSDAIAAIQPRVEILFLMDHNSIARNRLEPTATKVSFTKERANYQTVLSNLFFQAKLTSELRVDEAGEPFLWISPR